jgi:hypothetical protein
VGDHRDHGHWSGLHHNANRGNGGGIVLHSDGDAMSEQNLIERSWSVYEAHMRKQGLGATDEVSFVGGFMACFGMLTGRVDIGMPPDTPVLKLFERIQKELDAMRVKVIEGQAEERRNGG